MAGGGALKPKGRIHSGGGERGFSLPEMVVVVAVMLILAAVAAPVFTRAIHGIRSRGAGRDLASLVQAARMRAVQDDRFYSVRFGNSQAYVDICPQAVNGASGNNGNGIGTCVPAPPKPTPTDPLIEVSSEIILQPQSSAPNSGTGAGGLTKQFLSNNTGNVVPADGSTAASPITFGPQGLPCTPTAANGGTVCDTASSPLVAYWVFFQNSVSQEWGAVTVTPAGRIQKWYYSGGAWTVY